MSCTDKNKFKTSEASAKASMRTKGAIDQYLNIKDTNLFRKLNKEWSLDAKKRFNTVGLLFLEENNKAYPNSALFYQIDKAKGLAYNQKSDLTLVNTEEILNFTERIKDIFKDNTDEMHRLTGEFFYGNTVKTKDNRYFLFQEAQDPTEIDKLEYDRLNYEYEAIKADDIAQAKFIDSYLTIADLEQLHNPSLRFFFTQEQLRIADATEFYNRVLKPQENKEAISSSFVDNLIEKFYKNKQENSSLSSNLIDLHNSRVEDSIDVTEKKIEILKKSLNAEVIVDTSIEESGMLLGTNHPLSIKYNKPVIVINPNKLFSDTVIHEFGHLYIDLLAPEDSVLNQAYEALRGTDFHFQIKLKYPELSDNDLDKEVLATAIGLEGDKIFKNLNDLSNWQKIKNFILRYLSKIFNLNTNAIEQLAKEMLTNKVRLSGSERFNTVITQRSKYSVNKEAENKQTEVLNLFKQLNKDFNKQEIDNENVYTDKEGNVFNNSVTKHIKKYKTNAYKQDKGDFETKFDKSLFNKDNILFQLNAAKLPKALTKAMNDLIYERIGNSTFTKEADDKNWLDSYLREINSRKDDFDELAEEMADLKKQFNIDTFTEALLKNLDTVLNKADDYQKQYDKAPVVGSFIHDNIEEYVKNKTPFQKSLIDEDNVLLDTIKDIIDKGTKAGSKFVTEQVLFSENRQTPGTADLIEITKSGEVIIYDYKTVKSFEYNNRPLTSYSLYLSKGYLHQLVSYGAILNQYGITLAQNPYKIIAIEVDYKNYEETGDNVTINEVRVKDLKDKDLISYLNNAENQIYKDFSTSEKLADINIKPEIQSLDDLTNRINTYIDIYRKRTKYINSILDTSYIKKIENDLRSNKDLEKSIDAYIAKNNQLIIKSYVENMHKSLSVLEEQNDYVGSIPSSDYVEHLNYMLQSTEALKDIQKLLQEDTTIEFEDKDTLLRNISNTLTLVDKNKEYYKEKLARLSISHLSENSNLYYGYYTEKYKLEARTKGLKTKEEIEVHVLNELKRNETEIKVKEINYWTKQYEDGFVDLRYLEYQMADPGMSKSQFVQLVKNIMDKADLAKRNRMMDILPDINTWYKNIEYNKTGDPKEVWKKFLEKKTYFDSEENKQVTKLAGSIIPEFISDYREVFLKYENDIISLNRHLDKLYLKGKKTEEDNKKIISILEKIEVLKKERQEELKKGYETKEDDFEKLRINPEFSKLSEKEQEDARFIHKQLLDADERLLAAPDKRLVKQLKDGSNIYYLPKERMSNFEGFSSGETMKTFKSRFEDLVRPPKDEDEFNISSDEYRDTTGKSNLDIYGNEVFEIPVYYRNDLEDENTQSYDIPTLLTLNHETTIAFQESKLIEADLFVIKESLNSKNNNNVLKTDSFMSRKIKDISGKINQKSDQNLVYQAVKSSIDNRLYKRNYKGIYSKGNYRLIKSAEAVSKYASTLVLAGNFMSALSTFSQGTIYRAIEASVGEHMNQNDWKAGTKKAWSDIHKMLADTQKFLPESKTNLLIKKFGLETMQKSLTNKFVQDNFAKRNLDSETLYTVTSIAETMVTANLMYSLLNNIKVTNEEGKYINQDGKIVSKKDAMSLDEAYEAKYGKLILNKHVKYTTFNIAEKFTDGVNNDNTMAATEISRYIRSVYADLYGQYNQDMKSVFQRNIWGKLTMSLRQWLPRGAHKRWRGITDVVSIDNFMSFEDLRKEENIDRRFYSQDQKQFQEGHYVTSLRFIRSIYKEMKSNQLRMLAARNNVRNLMTDHELANLKRTQYELALMVMTAALGLFLRMLALSSGADDDDKEKLYFAAYLSNRINTELLTFIHPGEMFKMIQNPAASISVIERVFKWLWQLAGYSYTEQEGFEMNINQEYEKGDKKGENKAKIKTLGLIPGRVKYEQLKSILGFEADNTMEDSFKYQIKN